MITVPPGKGKSTIILLTSYIFLTSVPEQELHLAFSCHLLHNRDKKQILYALGTLVDTKRIKFHPNLDSLMVAL
jgi:hypothetical protein